MSPYAIRRVNKHNGLHSFVFVLLRNTTLRRQGNHSHGNKLSASIQASSLLLIQRVCTFACIFVSAHMHSHFMQISVCMSNMLFMCCEDKKALNLNLSTMEIGKHFLRVNALPSANLNSVSHSPSLTLWFFPFCFFVFKSSEWKRNVWLRKICGD